MYCPNYHKNGSLGDGHRVNRHQSLRKFKEPDQIINVNSENFLQSEISKNKRDLPH